MEHFLQNRFVVFRASITLRLELPIILYLIMLFTRLTLNASTILCYENLINVHINKRKFQCKNPFEFRSSRSRSSNILKMLKLPLVR